MVVSVGQKGLAQGGQVTGANGGLPFVPTGTNANPSDCGEEENGEDNKGSVDSRKGANRTRLYL